MELDSGAYIQTDSKSFTLSFTVLPGPVQSIEINVAALAFPQNHQFRAKCPRPSAVPLVVLSIAMQRAKKTPCLVNAAQVRIQKNHFPPCCFPLFHHVHNLLASEFPALVFLCVRAWSHTPPKHPHQQPPPRPNQKEPASSAHCPALVSKVVLLFGFCFPRLPGCCRSTAGHLPRHRCGGRAPALGIHHKVFDPSSLCFYS